MEKQHWWRSDIDSCAPGEARRYHFEYCRPTISQITHLHCCTSGRNVQRWMRVIMVQILCESIDFRKDVRQKQFSHLRPQWPWALTFWPQNCSASYAWRHVTWVTCQRSLNVLRCYCLPVNGWHGTDRQTDRQKEGVQRVMQPSRGRPHKFTEERERLKKFFKN